MNFDYVSLRRLERFFTDLKAWLASKYATKDVATTSTDGLMSATDKTKLDGIATAAQVNTIEHITANSTELTISEKTVDIPVFTGATAQAAGTAGLVPAPTAGAVDKVLKGDGTWGDAASKVRVSYDAANLEFQMDFSPVTWNENIGEFQYQVKKYGNKIWMIENYNEPVANYSSLYTGDTDGSIYGRLYIHTTDLEALGVSQPGWRLPTQTDWLDLIEYVTGTRPAMGARGLHPEWFTVNGLWNTDWSGEINKSGFAMLPAGVRNSDSAYVHRGLSGYYWGTDCVVSITNTDGDNLLIVNYLATTAPRYSLRFCKDA